MAVSWFLLLLLEVSGQEKKEGGGGLNTNSSCCRGVYVWGMHGRGREERFRKTKSCESRLEE